jgi:hypothetical protein
MATTTPNFGWSVPTSTDLVKDGATAIETLGDSIDASLVDLKGGTTGQVLKKNSNSDMDFVWSADSAGMTNPMTTTGDTIYSSSGSTPARLGIGTAGQFLKVNSGATAPEWATLSAGGMTEIATGNLTGSATIRIQSIPSTYKSLKLIVKNHIATNTNLSLRFRINNDSTANRYASSSSGQSTSETYRYDSVYCTTDLSNTTGNGIGVFTIDNYANTTTWKMFDIIAIGNNKTISTDIQLGRVLGAYNQTGAVTELDIYSDQGNWTAGTYILYGVN